MTAVPVYVPAPGVTGTVSTILPGSGIVGIRVESSAAAQVLIDFEGNRYGAVNIVTFADRCLHAHDRQTTSYPTIARAIVTSEALVHVGWLGDKPRDGSPRQVIVKPAGRKPLADWLGLEVDDLGPQLRCSR